MLQRCFTFLTAAILVHAISPHVFAQSEDTELDQIEAEVRKSERKVRPKAATEAPAEVKVESLVDLQKLAPFEDVSVLQKRFMPKTKRFQFFGGLSSLANDPWFLGIGLNGRVGYSFSESIGVEVGAFNLNSSSKAITTDLNNNVGVRTSSLVTTKSYFGADFVYTPMYGKISFFNSRIVPYDMYFAAGMGTTGVANSTVTSATTIHLGLGQIYALDKSVGFRWDLSLQNFSTPAGFVDGLAADAGMFTNVLLSFGVSFYYPGAKYR